MINTDLKWKYQYNFLNNILSRDRKGKHEERYIVLQTVDEVLEACIAWDNE